MKELIKDQLIEFVGVLSNSEVKREIKARVEKIEKRFLGLAEDKITVVFMPDSSKDYHDFGFEKMVFGKKELTAKINNFEKDRKKNDVQSHGVDSKEIVNDAAGNKLKVGDSVFSKEKTGFMESFIIDITKDKEVLLSGYALEENGNKKQEMPVVFRLSEKDINANLYFTEKERFIEVKDILISLIEQCEINKEIKENTKVKVIPATKEQKEQYSRHIDGLEFSDMPKEDFPLFSKEQLNSVPDIIEGYSLTDYDKRLLLVDELQQLPYGIQFEIDSDNYLKSTFLTVGKDENDIGQETKFITKEDVQFNKQESIVPMLDVYLVDKEGYVYFEKVEKPLKVGDKINLLTKSGDLYAKGEVKNIANGEIEVNTSKGILRAPFDARIEPLFLIDSQNNKTNIEYGVNETIALLTKKELGLHENYFVNRMNDFTDLVKGNKTSILPFEKGSEKEEGKLQIIKNLEGNPFVSLNLKNPKLNIESPFIQYGEDRFKLNQEQKEQLKKTGELGLVNLTSVITNKDSKLWVSVDKDLNKIVTKKNDDIKINKIFGATTTEEEKTKLRSGEGILLDLKGTNYFIIASAASKNSDGLRTFTESKAREFKLIPTNIEEYKNKTQKPSGIKI